jgi:hypothetical protein
MPKNLRMKRKNYRNLALIKAGKIIALFALQPMRMGDRRLALCSLANPAGQPTERLETGPRRTSRPK